MKCKYEHDGDCCNCGSTQYMCKCKPKICSSVAPMTNADRIRAMSDEELAEVIMCPYDCDSAFCGGNTFVKCRVGWLRQPAEGEQHG